MGGWAFQAWFLTFSRAKKSMWPLYLDDLIYIYQRLCQTSAKLNQSLFIWILTSGTSLWAGWPEQWDCRHKVRISVMQGDCSVMQLLFYFDRSKLKWHSWWRVPSLLLPLGLYRHIAAGKRPRTLFREKGSGFRAAPLGQPQFYETNVRAHCSTLYDWILPKTNR